MEMLNYLKIILFVVVVAGCNSRQDSLETKSRKGPLRFGMVTGLSADRVEYYKELHANAWPGVLKRISESNIRNYSIYLHKINGKHYLFSYYEYYGSDYAADMKKMAEDSITRQWWKETDPCQVPLPEASAEGRIWAGMEEVFHAE